MFYFIVAISTIAPAPAPPPHRGASPAHGVRCSPNGCADRASGTRASAARPSSADWSLETAARASRERTPPCGWRSRARSAPIIVRQSETSAVLRGCGARASSKPIASSTLKRGASRSRNVTASSTAQSINPCSSKLIIDLMTMSAEAGRGNISSRRKWSGFCR